MLYGLKGLLIYLDTYPFISIYIFIYQPFKNSKYELEREQKFLRENMGIVEMRNKALLTELSTHPPF